MIKSYFAAALIALGLVSAANAASIGFTANDGSASASLDLTGTTLTIVLNNLTTAPNTTGAVNLLTGFTLVPSISGAGYSISSQNGAQLFTFANNSTTTGSVSNGSFSPNWALTTSPNGLYFNGFGTGGLPIIGPAASDTSYVNGGASLASGPHGTDIYKTATFVLTVPTSFSLTAVSGANFLFNTDGSTVVGGTPTPGGGPRPVPLPAAVWGAGAMLGLMGAVKLRKRA